MSKSGITLMELVVVMVIIAIGAVLMAPNIGTWLHNYRLRSAARDITSMLRLAQMKAVTTNVEYQVMFDLDPPDNPEYPDSKATIVLQRNSGGVWVKEGDLQWLPKGINIDISGSTAIQFNPNSTSSGGRVTLTNVKGRRKVITVTTSTGRVRLDGD